MLEPLKLLLSKGADPDLGDPEANPTIPATPLNLVCNQLRQAAAMGNELETHDGAPRRAPGRDGRRVRAAHGIVPRPGHDGADRLRCPLFLAPRAGAPGATR